MAGSGDAEPRFAFGENWARFLAKLDDRRIAAAESSLAAMLGHVDLAGAHFLDVGSGSGLSSLAARRLGADVHSFDYDSTSVAVTAELRRRYFADDDHWRVEQGSALDREYLRKLGTFDVVYSWGVLHHTGAMWEAMGYLVDLVAPGGTLFIALYNDQGMVSRIWRRLKKRYSQSSRFARALIVLTASLYLWGPTWTRDLARGHPLETWRARAADRGMSAWHDLVDWVGGYPFEVATPGAVFDFYRKRGFSLVCLVSRRGHGCNEYVFTKDGGRVRD